MWYTIMLFFHIVGVVILFATMGAEFLSNIARRRAQNTDQVLAIGAIGRFNHILHPLALLLILVAGVYLATTAGSFSHAWVFFALVFTLLLPILSIAIDSRQTTIIHHLALASTSKELSAELRARIQDPVLGAWNTVGPILVVWIVFLMTVKPEIAGTLISLLVALALSLACSIPFWRKAAASQAAHVTQQP